jgi:cytochrome P450
MLSDRVHDDVLQIDMEGDYFDLHERLAALRARAPIAPVRFMGEDAWMILTYEGVREGLRDEETLPVRPYFEAVTDPAVGRSLMTMEGDDHTRNRRLVSPSFRKAFVSTYIETILEPTCQGLIDSFEGRRTIDLVAEYTHALPMIVITRLLGLPPHEYATLERWSNQLFSYAIDPEGALQARREFTDYLRLAMDDRRSNRREDLISRLLGAQEVDAGLTDEEVYSFLRLLFPAGVHNTSNALGTTIWALLTQTADGFKRVRSEEGVAAAAVEEALRWDNPLPNGVRRSVLERDWFGITVPAGSMLLLSQASAHRDPAVFRDPDRFDIDRHPEDLLVFGLGAHFCIGAALARLEVRLGLKLLANRCRGMRLVDADASRPRGGAQRGPATLAVEIQW